MTFSSRRFAGLATGFALATSLACAPEGSSFAPPNPSAIDGAYVEQVISTLAADDMRGRAAFSDDALRAADYLAGEFEAAGLTPMPGAQGFVQGFTVQSIAVGGASASVDGAAVPADRLIVRLGSSSLSWSTGDITPVVVGPGEDVGASIDAVMQGGGDALFFIDPSHAGVMANIGRFLRRPATVIEGSAGQTMVLALTDAGADAPFEIMATGDVTERPLANVAGMIPGTRANEYVLFSAHYDHIGIRPAVDGDSIANGANDDASGTTAVVALARYFAARGTPERSILFAAFTAEEAGGYGARYYSSQLDPDQIVAMFNIEMIGTTGARGPNTAWITGFERSTFGPILQQAVAGTQYEFYPDPYPDQNLFYRSDNATLARLGVPAHSISTTAIDVDPNYHQVSDEVSTLDLDHMTNTIRAIAMGSETIIAGTATPTRVDPATVN